MIDLLHLAASAVSYYHTGPDAATDELTIVWFVAAHPEDNLPYVVGVEFEEAK